jgi:hypothetical protein
VNPPSGFTIPNDSRVLEDAKMKRETRLRGVQSISEIAHAPLPTVQHLDDLETCFVGEGVKKHDGSSGLGSGSNGHGI